MDGLDTADLTLVVGCEFLAFSDLVVFCLALPEPLALGPIDFGDGFV